MFFITSKAYHQDTIGFNSLRQYEVAHDAGLLYTHFLFIRLYWSYSIAIALIMKWVLLLLPHIKVVEKTQTHTKHHLLSHAELALH